MIKVSQLLFDSKSINRNHTHTTNKYKNNLIDKIQEINNLIKDPTIVYIQEAINYSSGALDITVYRLETDQQYLNRLLNIFKDQTHSIANYKKELNRLIIALQSSETRDSKVVVTDKVLDISKLTLTQLKKELAAIKGNPSIQVKGSQICFDYSKQVVTYNTTLDYRKRVLNIENLIKTSESDYEKTRLKIKELDSNPIH